MENITRHNPEDNYNPNDVATNAPDFEEPSTDNFSNAPHDYDEEYRKYYEELRENNRPQNNAPVRAPQKAPSPKNNSESYNKKYTLKKPFNFEGEWMTEVNLDLDNLTGKDIMEASKGVDSFVQETDKRYLCAVAAKAMKRPTEIMLYMSAKDVTAICYFISDFLID